MDVCIVGVILRECFISTDRFPLCPFNKNNGVKKSRPPANVNALCVQTIFERVFA